MNAIRLKGWGWETWQEVAVGGPDSHDVGELLQDLRKPIPVPDGVGTIHGWTHEELQIRTSLAGDGQLLQELDEDRLGAEPGRVRASRAGHEISDAIDDADGGLDSNRAQSGGQHWHRATLDNLSAGHHRTIAAVHRAHVALDVGVTDEGERVTGRHRRKSLKIFKTKISFVSVVTLFVLISFDRKEEIYSVT